MAPTGSFKDSQLPLDEFLAVNNIQFIRFLWNDLSNMTRLRVIPTASFLKMMRRKRPGVHIAFAGLGLVHLKLAVGFGSTGEWLYVPDLSSLKVCGYAPGHASLLGFFQVKDPSPGESLTVPICPRTVLAKVVESAKTQFGIDFLMGFETEFILLSSVSPWVAANPRGWHESPALQAGSVVSETLEDMALSLAKSGIELEMYHSEAAPGQYEFVTGARAPMEAVDNLILTRETVYNIANKHGLKATLAPRIHKDSCGSACHVHLSLKGKEPAPSADIDIAPGFNTLDASFLQSLLEHLASVAAFSLPIDGSYERMVDGVWTGGTYISWGRENRETPVRLCGVSNDFHFEIRCHDGTANPYLSVASMLAAGMLGVASKAKLTIQPSQEAPATLTEAERKKLGVSIRMPLNRKEAHKNLLGDKPLINALGEEIVEKYLAVNDVLCKALTKDGDDQEPYNIMELF